MTEIWSDINHFEQIELH